MVNLINLYHQYIMADGFVNNVNNYNNY
jgi:hypothetical protein